MTVQAFTSMFICEAKTQQPGTSLMLSSLSCSITVQLLRELKNNMPCWVKKIRHIDIKRIKRVIDYMNEFYNTDCTLDTFAGIADLSCYHFIREFKNYTGKTPFEYLLDIRIERAQQMLEDNNLSITDVYTRCGFNSAGHFINVFKNRTGVTPSYYRYSIISETTSQDKPSSH